MIDAVERDWSVTRLPDFAASLDSEHIHRAVQLHVRPRFIEKPRHGGARAVGISAPTGHHRDVLLPVNLERRGRTLDAGTGLELPQELAGLRIERVEHL